MHLVFDFISDGTALECRTVEAINTVVPDLCFEGFVGCLSLDWERGVETFDVRRQTRTRRIQQVKYLIEECMCEMLVVLLLISSSSRGFWLGCIVLTFSALLRRRFGSKTLQSIVW